MGVLDSGCRALPWGWGRVFHSSLLQWPFRLMMKRLLLLVGWPTFVGVTDPSVFLAGGRDECREDQPGVLSGHQPTVRPWSMEKRAGCLVPGPSQHLCGVGNEGDRRAPTGTTAGHSQMVSGLQVRACFPAPSSGISFLFLVTGQISGLGLGAAREGGGERLMWRTLRASEGENCWRCGWGRRCSHICMALVRG